MLRECQKVPGLCELHLAGYLATLRMPLLAGRDLSSTDMASSRAVAIVNQTFARGFLPGVNPVGRTYLEGVLAQPVEVVGLVEDSKYFSLREEARAIAFVPITQAPAVLLGFPETIELRTAIPPSGLILSVRAAVARVSSAIPLEFHTLAQQVNDSWSRSDRSCSSPASLAPWCCCWR